MVEGRTPTVRITVLAGAGDGVAVVPARLTNQRRPTMKSPKRLSQNRNKTSHRHRRQNKSRSHPRNPRNHKLLSNRRNLLRRNSSRLRSSNSSRLRNNCNNRPPLHAGSRGSGSRTGVTRRRRPRLW